MLAGLQARRLPCVPCGGDSASAQSGHGLLQKEVSGLYAPGLSHARQRTVWLSRRLVWPDWAGRNPCKANRQRKIPKPGALGALPAWALLDAIDDRMMGFDLRVKQGAFTDMKAVPLCRPDQDLGLGLIANAAVQLPGFDPLADNRWIDD